MCGEVWYNILINIKAGAFMIKKKIVNFKDGSFKTNVRVMLSYRPGPGLEPKQKTIKNFGYMEDYPNQKEFWEMVNREDEKAKSGHGDDMVLVVPKNQKNNAKINQTYNYGYKFIESILNELKLDEFFDNVEFRGESSLFDIFSFLVYERIINPSSKRNNMRHIDYYYDKKFDFELYDVYRALDKFSEISFKMQAHINDMIKKIIGRDESYSFYDVTNFYFEKDFNGPLGTFPQKGVSKEHRTTPIVQFGMFMDSNNIPIAMKAYPGNTSDCLTLQPSMSEIKKDYHLKRLIVVADKGMNSQANIDYICNNNDGYVVSQTLKGKKGKRYHDIMFDPEGYEGTDDFRYKLFEEEYESNINKKKKTIRKRKVLIYWSKADAAYAKRKREEKILKAEKELQNNVYSTGHSNSSENKNIVTQYFVSGTGEIADNEIKSVNYDKFTEDEKYDGYFCIITSELDYDYKKILETYHHLSYIEESFKITKSDLETRPVYVTTDSHIDAHLLSCFVSLIVLRMMQYKMGIDKLPAARIKKVIEMCTCQQVNDLYVHLDSVSGNYEYETITSKNYITYMATKIDKSEDITRNDFLMLQNCYDVDFDECYMKTNLFNKELKRIKYKIRKIK